MSVNSELGGDSSSNLSDISDTSATKTDGEFNIFNLYVFLLVMDNTLLCFRHFFK